MPTPLGRILNWAMVSGLVLLSGCISQSQRPSSDTFRVMTYNIHHGEGLDGKIDLLRIAQVIQREGADIVALQEVDKGVERTARRDFPAELAELTGMTCIFSNNFFFQGGEYGNAVLTRFPVVTWTNTHYQMLRPAEQRGLLQVALDVRGHDLVFMNTHIDYRPEDEERFFNAQQIEQIVKRYDARAIILCGDFNDREGSRTHAKVAADFDDAWQLAGQGDGFTISANQPHKRIDYIWLSKNKAIIPVKIWVPRSEASDHLPLAGEFRFR